MAYLGIDIGTTGCKATAFDATGRECARAYREYPTQSPAPGWYELDVGLVLANCFEVIREASGVVSSEDPVRALGVSSQGEAFTLLDGAGACLCPAMVSFDTRSRPQMHAFTKEFGAHELYSITGHSPHTLFSLFKLLWIRDQQPDVWRRAAHVLCMADLLAWKLTGRMATTPNMAARTMLFDVRRLEWSEPILDAVGLRRAMLPEPLEPGRSFGSIGRECAAQLGLNEGVAVTIGGHDQSCGALGAGATGSGVAAYSIGSVECITPVFDRCVLDDTMRRANLATYPYLVGGLYTTVAFNTTGGSLLRWYRDTFGPAMAGPAGTADTGIYDRILSEIPGSPTSLLVLPHFASTGTPWFDPAPLSAVLGLNLGTTRGTFVKGLLEGVTYEMRLNLAQLERAGVSIDVLRASGGGARSDAWLQIKADILNTPIERLGTSEAGCLGAAMLAAHAVGEAGSLPELSARWVSPCRRFEPDPARAEQYAARYRIYADLYETLASVRERLNQID